jgi:copper(I)-binding protein
LEQVCVRFVISNRFFSVGLILLSVMLTSCSVQDDIAVDNAWIPEAPPSVSALAGYLDITNHFSKTMILSGAKSPFFNEVILHQTVVDSETDFARMIEQSTVSIEAGQTLKLNPGGYHLMLLNPRQMINTEKLIPIILLFENGYQKMVDFKVRPFRLHLEAD